MNPLFKNFTVERINFEKGFSIYLLQLRMSVWILFTCDCHILRTRIDNVKVLSFPKSSPFLCGHFSHWLDDRLVKLSSPVLIVTFTPFIVIPPLAFAVVPRLHAFLSPWSYLPMAAFTGRCGRATRHELGRSAIRSVGRLFRVAFSAARPIASSRAIRYTGQCGCQLPRHRQHGAHVAWNGRREGRQTSTFPALCTPFGSRGRHVYRLSFLRIHSGFG